MARGGKREGAGAPKGSNVGNNNSSKDNRLWRNTIQRAIAQGDPDRLRKIAEKLLEKAEEGDLGALKELGDRIDGKAAQQIVVAGDSDNPVQTVTTIKLVGPE